MCSKYAPLPCRQESRGGGGAAAGDGRAGQPRGGDGGSGTWWVMILLSYPENYIITKYFRDCELAFQLMYFD